MKKTHYIQDELPMTYVAEHPNPLIRAVERHRQETIIRLARPLRNKTIVELGAEHGMISKQLIDQILVCKKLICVDYSKKNIEIAKKNLAEYKNVEFVKSDAQNIRLPSNTADVTLSTMILEHLPDTKKSVSELARITKPDGKIVINVPNEKLVLAAKKLMPKFLLGNLRRGMTPEHVQVFDKKSLKEVLSEKCEIKRIFYSPSLLSIFVLAKPKKTVKQGIKPGKP